MRENIKILLIDENKEDSKKIFDLLVSENYPDPIIVDNEKRFKELCSVDQNFDVIIAEEQLGIYNSLQIFNLAKIKCDNIIFIVVSDKITDDFGLELLKEGVDIYFMKDSIFKLPVVIEKLYMGRKIQKRISELEKDHILLKEAYKEIETKNQNIIESIVFAKRIQDLTLPKIDLLLKNFDEAFVLHKPKDIVSGDFYWFNRCTIHNRFMVAVGDCTGHGVSGALLAMIGYNLLTEITNDADHSSSPTDILMEMDKHMCSLLQQNTSTGYQDGIDMSYISVDQENQKIYFCGCRRPLLYLVRNEKKIIVYKGEPYIVGGNDTRHVKTFKTQEIDYQKGDIIYMLSDGYTDQFGGPDNKKLMKEEFSKILLSIQHLNLNFQAQLLEQKLYKWMGDNEQTDDILVVGIKL